MKELQEKMKGMKQNDPRLKELQMDQLRLMKEGNPLGGCLPLLIQMPFLFALYRAITISLDFRQASFLVDSRSLSRRAVSDSPSADPDDGHDGCPATGDAGSFGGSFAAKNDGDRYADGHALCFVERSVRFSFVLARW